MQNYCPLVYKMEWNLLFCNLYISTHEINKKIRLKNSYMPLKLFKSPVQLLKEVLFSREVLLNNYMLSSTYYCCPVAQSVAQDYIVTLVL